MTPRILLVHGNAEWYGSDRSVTLLATALHELGWQVEVAVPTDGPLVDALHAVPIGTVRYDPAPLRARQFTKRRLLRYFALDLPRSIWHSRRVMRDADLVHMNTSILLGGLIGARLARRPSVLHVRESYAGHERQLRLYGRVIKPLTSRIIAISNDIGAELAAAGLGDRTVVIHNGLDFGEPVPARSGGVNGPVVAVGRINEWKGHDVLIEAIALLRARDVIVAVQIAGDPFPGEEHLLERLEELARRLGVGDQVTFLGYVADVEGLLDRCGVFVLPSVSPEPFGLALIEAMGRGLPCIATDAGGPRDIIDDGRTGLLVPPGDVGALADAIERLWRDPSLRTTLGRVAASDVRARFSIQTTAKRVSALYDELLEGRRGRASA